MAKRIRKAVIPAAGWGTRFLPATKAIPKELLPIIDKPVIQHTVEEAVASGIDQIIIVTSPNKGRLEAHFNPYPELESSLERKGDSDMLKKVQRTCGPADIRFVVQNEPRGLGHAVLTAAEMVGDEPFAVFLPDDLFGAEPPVIGQMAEVYERYGGSVIALLRVVPEDTKRYGIVKPETVEERIYRIIDMVEKPVPEKAPSLLAIMGRYILTPEIFDALRATKPGKGGEIQLTDGMALLHRSQDIYGYEFDGIYYDAGKPLGLLKTSIAWGLKHPEMGPELREYIRNLLDET
ncbi:MAG: UTP--glucose-1-phosphate uridylyltransferase GalU [Chloroflexota bacterium]|nr:UTP--glucose-1-phosphate uridylyltransferase GalU [Chloroflexota bacterium]